MVSNVYLFIYIYLLIYLLLKLFIIEDSFDLSSDRTVPLNVTAAVLHFFFLFVLCLPSFSNFLAFYFLIRDSFKKYSAKEGLILEKDDINNSSHLDSKLLSEAIIIESADKSNKNFVKKQTVDTNDAERFLDDTKT